ncbi:MAG: Shedu immune nuclease family protein [Minisyncoccia bacterium]
MNYEFIKNKLTDKIYISKRIAHNNSDGSVSNIRYVSKVIDSKEIWEEVRQKKEIVLRVTSGSRQEILAKVLEKNNGIYVLTLQRYTIKTGNPHEISFSFVGNEIKQLKEFIDSIHLLNFKGEEKSRVEEADLLRIKNIFLKNPDIKLIEETLKQNITNKDIVALGYRKAQLEIFRKLLYENYLPIYKKQIRKENSKDEIIWQYFFEENKWIFGYGLDYRFQGILQKEFSASNSEANGSNTVFSDFLLGDRRFTTFVELKKPETSIFGNNKNRSNCWQFSNDLINAISQVLEQKASGQIKLETNKQHDQSGNEIKQKAYDSKVILIIGNWKEIEKCTDLDKKIKEKTFELFRRDSRNVEIITYDELYERAKFIVYDSNV